MSRPLIVAPVSDEVRAAVESGRAAHRAATETHGPSEDRKSVV